MKQTVILTCILIKIFSLISLLFINGVLYSYIEEKNNQDSLIKEVIDISGWEREFEKMPKYLMDQLSQFKDKMKPESYKQVKTLLLDSYKPNSFYNILLEYYKKELEQEDIVELIGWFRSPTYKKFHDLESIHSDSIDFTAIEDYKFESESNPSLQLRVNTIRQMSDSSNTTKFMFDLFVLNQHLFAKAINPACLPGEQLSEEELKEINNRIKIEYWPKFKQNEINSFLYTYRSVSDDELMKYLSFYNTEAGKRYNSVSYRAMTAAFTKFAEVLEKKISKQFPP